MGLFTFLLLHDFSHYNITHITEVASDLPARLFPSYLDEKTGN